MAVDWRERIGVDENVCHGKPCIRGTRVMVSTILDNLASGVGEQELLVSYPSLTTDDLAAAVAYESCLTKEPSIVRHFEELDYLRMRAARATSEKFREALRHVPDVEPEDPDKF